MSFPLYGAFDIKSGYLVTVSDGTTTRSHIVRPLAFDIMDKGADTISGFAGADSRVDVWACDNTNCYIRHVTATSFGKWIANWATWGTQDDEKNTFDLENIIWAESQEWDNNGNRTAFWCNLNPYIQVAPYSKWIHTRSWPKDTLITMEIDDPSDGIGINDEDEDGPVDYTVQDWMDQDPWDPYDPNTNFADFEGWPGQFAPGPGYVITMTGIIYGSTVTKTLTISDLQATSADSVTDIVSGIATPGIPNVEVCLWRPVSNCLWLYPTVNGTTGEWNAYYGDADLQPGDSGWVTEYDADSNSTWYYWRVPNPYFDVRENIDQIEAWEWPLGATVTLEIDNPGSPDDPDYSMAQVIALCPWDSSRTYSEFNVGESIDIQAGFEVRMSDGITTKMLTVSNLSFTSVDIDNDLVYGIADPKVPVNVWACDGSGCYNYHTTSDNLGTWLVDMTQPSDQGVAFNIINGTWIDSDQRNEYGDSTMFRLDIPNPRIEASTRGTTGWKRASGLSTLILL